jgi:hypothetical protein
MTCGTKSKKENGRPTQYTTEIATAICERLSNRESLRAICADAGMPAKATVREWLSCYPEFREQYEYTLEGIAEEFADEILKIIDDAKGDYVEKVGANGKVVTVFDRYNLARSRLRCDVHRWVVERLAPNGFRWTADIPEIGPLPDVEPK